MTAIETLAVAVSTSLVAYGVLIAHYKTAPPRRRPAKKPGVAFLPKYRFSMELPPTIAVAEDPVPMLGERLARLVVPPTSNAHASIAYGAFALFDAGALWSLSHRIESAVHAGAE